MGEKILPVNCNDFTTEGLPDFLIGKIQLLLIAHVQYEEFIFSVLIIPSIFAMNYENSIVIVVFRN